MNKWQVAKHLINAKKNVDSILFIFRHKKELSNIDWKLKVEGLYKSFYISCCIVLDECFKGKKKELCQDKIIDRIYYERDKMAAHDDETYKPLKFKSLLELIKAMKDQLYHIKKICRKALPENLTLDYVSHDPELFRLIYRVNADLEKDVETIKFPVGTFHSYQLSKEGQHYFHNHDTSYQDRENARMFGYNYDDMIKQMEKQKSEPQCNWDKKEKEREEKRKQIIQQNRINTYEMIQHLQDECITNNILNSTSTWYSVNYAELKKIENMHARGILDQFEIPDMYKYFNIQKGFNNE